MSSVLRIFLYPFRVSESNQLNVSLERVEAYRSGVMSLMSSEIGTCSSFYVIPRVRMS